MVDGMEMGGRNAAVDDLAEHIARERNRWALKSAELIGPDDCPMMRRWVLVTPAGSIRLHHFLRSDDERHLHDHPWWFLTLVLAGEYVDEAACHACEGDGFVYLLGFQHSSRPCFTCRARGVVRDRLRRGSIRFRPALHRHQVKTAGCWTLVVTGRNERRWGFWDRGVFRPVAEYFRRYGYAACEDIERRSGR